jgi:hypothetical protein
VWDTGFFCIAAVANIASVVVQRADRTAWLSAADVRSGGIGSDVCEEGANGVPLVERTQTVKYMILAFASQQQYQEMVGQPSGQPAWTQETDGPYAETEEVLAGSWVVACDSFDRATEIAARLAGCPGPERLRARAYADVRPIDEHQPEAGDRTAALEAYRAAARVATNLQQQRYLNRQITRLSKQFPR